MTISIEPRGGFKVACYGRIVPVSLRAPVIAMENVLSRKVLQLSSESSPVSIVTAPAPLMSAMMGSSARRASRTISGDAKDE